MITTIIFDYGGIFSKKASLREFCEVYAQEHNLDTAAMKELILRLWMTARVNGKGAGLFFEEMAKFARKEVEEFKQEFIAFFGHNEEMETFVVKELQGKYKLGLLSNNVEPWLEPILEKKGYKKIFDAIVTSYGSKIAKPDKKIYTEILERLQVRPEECLFIDDDKRNLIPAQELGMKTIWFANTEQCKREIKKYLQK